MIVEKYNRNPSVSSSEDINEKHFLIDEHKVKIVYHYDLNSFVKSTRTFTIPLSNDLKEFIKKNPDKINIYEVIVYNNCIKLIKISYIKIL